MYTLTPPVSTLEKWVVKGRDRCRVLLTNRFVFLRCSFLFNRKCKAGWCCSECSWTWWLKNECELVAPRFERKKGDSGNVARCSVLAELNYSHAPSLSLSLYYTFDNLNMTCVQLAVISATTSTPVTSPWYWFSVSDEAGMMKVPSLVVFAH